MHDTSGLGILLIATVAIPAGALLAAVLAIAAYRSRALKQYWFVILASYFGPWMLAALGGREAVEEFADMVWHPGGPSLFPLVPLIGLCIAVGAWRYWLRNIREHARRVS